MKTSGKIISVLLATFVGIIFFSEDQDGETKNIDTQKSESISQFSQESGQNQLSGEYTKEVEVLQQEPFVERQSFSIGQENLSSTNTGESEVFSDEIYLEEFFPSEEKESIESLETSIVNPSTLISNEKEIKEEVLENDIIISTPQCNSNYSGCLKIGAGDYDCAGGSGDGPNYTGLVQVLGYDEFGLDRDKDGWGCE